MKMKAKSELNAPLKNHIFSLMEQINAMAPGFALWEACTGNFVHLYSDKTHTHTRSVTESARFIEIEPTETTKVYTKNRSVACATKYRYFYQNKVN